MTQSTRGGGNANDEVSQIDRAQIFQFAGYVKSAVDRMRIINSCADEDISADADFWAHISYEHTPTVSDGCKIYHPDGGAVSYQTPKEEWLDQNASPNGGLAFQKTWHLYYANVEGIAQSGAPDGTDLVLNLCCLKQDICMALNDDLGVANDGSDAPQSGTIYTNRAFVGTSSYAQNTSIVSAAPEFYGHQSACVKDVGDDTYNFYNVLIER